jgi:hypothetical protein
VRQAEILSAETAPPIPVDDKDLLGRFESLGDNCEFGFLQRYAGVEEPSLLRFNSTRVDRLIHGLRNRFADLALDGSMSVVWTNEWMVHESCYKFVYHSLNSDTNCDLNKLLKQQAAWLRYMAEKFMERLEIGDRIYVRKGTTDTMESAIALGSHLRNHGPATLLWVTVADADHPNGTVAWIGDGVMRGWIQRFASYDRTGDIEPIGWINLLRRAWALRYLQDPMAYPTRAPTNHLAQNFGGWCGSSRATAEFVWHVPHSPRRGQVMKHVFVQDTGGGASIFGCMAKDGLVAGGQYVASVYVWIDAESSVTSVGMVFLGRATIRANSADMTKRNAWQLIWVTARLPEQDVVAFPVLTPVGPKGAVIYSAAWRLELGSVPQLD